MGILATVKQAIFRGAGSGGGIPERGAIDSTSGFDATKPKGKRQAPTGLLRSEDAELNPAARRAMITAHRDIHRNFAVAAWAIRKHLDYTTSFRFKSKTGNREFDAAVEKFIEKAGKKQNFDVAGRHSLARAVRMSEARRIVDGDIGWFKLSSGKTQILEGDRIMTPYGGLPVSVDRGRLNRGVLVDSAGGASAYVVCRRAKTTDSGLLGQDMTFETILPARWVYLHACWDLSRFDQVRGISPLASAYNTFRDAYEGVDYALAKSKVAQLFALQVFRDATDDEALGEVTESSTAAAEDDSGEQTSESTEEKPRYDVNFGRGPVLLDLDAGDKAEILESKTPSTEFQAFVPMVIGMALKALDIPFSWYDEAYVNFSGGKQATINYEKSAGVKRGEVRELLDEWTTWRLNIAIDDGELELPAGMTRQDLAYIWQAAGTPWLDPLKERVGAIAGMGAGIDSPITIIEETTGRPAREVLEDIAEFLAMYDELGIPRPSWAQTIDPAALAEDPPAPPPSDAPKAPEKQPQKSSARKSYTDALTLAMATPDEPLARRTNGVNGHA